MPFGRSFSRHVDVGAHLLAGGRQPGRRFVGHRLTNRPLSSSATNGEEGAPNWNLRVSYFIGFFFLLS